MITFDSLMTELRHTGPRIGAQAAAGNAKAKQVVNLYKMVYARSDEGTKALLCAAYDEWKRAES